MESFAKVSSVLSCSKLKQVNLSKDWLSFLAPTSEIRSMRGAHPTTDNDNHKIPLSSGHRISTILAPDSQRTFFPLFMAFQFVGLGDQRILHNGRPLSPSSTHQIFRICQPRSSLPYFMDAVFIGFPRRLIDSIDFDSFASTRYQGSFPAVEDQVTGIRAVRSPS